MNLEWAWFVRNIMPGSLHRLNSITNDNRHKNELLHFVFEDIEKSIKFENNNNHPLKVTRKCARCACKILMGNPKIFG